MLRSSCAVCENIKLELLYTLHNFPLCHSGTNLPLETDRFGDLEFVACIQCGCVQLQNLEDPSILYKDAHNLTYLSPTWSEHHLLFSDFVATNTESKKFMEIGGYSGILAKYILEKKKDVWYSILDLCDVDPKIPSIDFFHGNCEEFTFDQEQTLLLSHTFEHLYNPALFVQNISKQSVKEVFLSLPNLEGWLREGAISFLHIEHTFLYNESMIQSMFKKYGYLCSKISYFKNHSIFFHFVKDEMSDRNVNWEESTYLIQKMRTYFYTRETISKNISIDTPFFIFPAGHFGQMAYFFLKQFQGKCMGFLDNDPSKVNKRVYGSSHLAYFPDVISNHIDTPVQVILCGGPYTNEIKEQILKINSRCRFLVIDLVNPCTE
jgi:hypothetical protein